MDTCTPETKVNKVIFLYPAVVIWMGSAPQQYVACGNQTWQVNKMLRYTPTHHNQRETELDTCDGKLGSLDESQDLTVLWKTIQTEIMF